MTASASPWLPATALASVRAAQPVARLVAAWSERWFASDGWRAGPSFECDPDGEWTTLRQGVCVGVSGRPRAVRELAFAILGVPPRPDLAPSDLALLRRIAGAALDDLMATIEAEITGPAAAGPRWRLPVGGAGEQPLAIDIAEGSLARVGRQAFRRRVRPGALASPRAVVADRTIDCAAHLGCATLAVAQFGALEPGDVIVLDQPVNDIVPLAIAGRRSDLRVALGAGHPRG